MFSAAVKSALQGNRAGAHYSQDMGQVCVSRLQGMTTHFQFIFKGKLPQPLDSVDLAGRFGEGGNKGHLLVRRSSSSYILPLMIWCARLPKGSFNIYERENTYISRSDPRYSCHLYNHSLTDAPRCVHGFIQNIKNQAHSS